MNLGSAAKVYANNAVWRTTGAHSAGRALVRALASGDESVRMLAGMLLVQGGRRALPLLREAIARGEGLPELLTVLADVGTREDAALLRRLAPHPDPAVARAARDGMETLALRTGPGSPTDA